MSGGMLWCMKLAVDSSSEILPDLLWLIMLLYEYSACVVSRPRRRRRFSLHRMMMTKMMTMRMMHDSTPEGTEHDMSEHTMMHTNSSVVRQNEMSEHTKMNTNSSVVRINDTLENT